MSIKMFSFPILMAKTAIGYLKLSLLSFCKCNGGGLMKRVMVGSGWTREGVLRCVCPWRHSLLIYVS